MKRLYFVTMFIWAVVGNLSAQTDSIPLGSLNSIAGQLTRQSVTSTLFPLADGLMLAQSFDEVARQLTRNGFTKVEVDDGVLTAESSLCDLRAVNRSGRAAQIDTLTLFVKRSLNRDILKDSLQRASYTFIETSADQRYDWYKRADGITLAVYFVYKDPYKSAMLFARPQRELHIPTPPLSVNSGALSVKTVKLATLISLGSERLKVQVNFPHASGGVASALNDAALRSPLLAHFVRVQPSLPANVSVQEGVKAYLLQMKKELSARPSPLTMFPQLFDVSVLPAAETREGVITYVNHVSFQDPDAPSYRLVSNFDAVTGRMLTFDDVFRPDKRATVIELLKVAGAQPPVTGALENFILGDRQITFILLVADERGTHEVAYTYDYDKLQKLMR